MLKAKIINIIKNLRFITIREELKKLKECLSSFNSFF